MTEILLAIEIIGVISFAVAGAIVAIDKETDIFGVVFLSLITCFGGGIIRDITIGRHPPAFFRELSYQAIIGACVAITVFVLARLFKHQYVKREQTVLAINNYIDALAIGISFGVLPDVNITLAVALIGIITLALCMVGVKVGNIFGAKYKSKAEFAGGVILVLLGTKILIEHLTA